MLRGGLVIYILLIAGNSAAFGQLRAEKPSIDLGEIRSGPGLSQTFTLVNDGPDRVDVLELQPSCGCALARIDRQVVAPASKANLTLTINTFGQAAGPHTWKTTVRWRRDKVEELALEVHALLITEVSVQPAALTIFTEGTRSHDILLTDRRDRPLTITSVQSNIAGIRAELVTQSAGVATIRVQASADLWPGRHEAMVSIFSDDPFYRHLQVPVRVVKQPRSAISFGPRQVEFRGASGQPLAAKLVRLWSGQDAAIHIGRVYADDPVILCTWAAGPENQATVKIRVDPARLPVKRRETAVHVEVRQPVVEIVTIPVTIERD